MPRERETKLDLLAERQFELALRADQKGNRTAELHFLEFGMQVAVKLNNYGRHLRKE